MIYPFLKIFSKPLIAAIFFSVCASPLFAEEENRDPATLKKGVIANSSSTTTSAAVNVDTGDAAPGGEATPVTASINKLSRGKCEVKVSNSSAKSGYSVRYRVVTVTETGGEDRRFFSATLKPKESVSRPFPCNHSSNMSVELVSGKRTS